MGTNYAPLVADFFLFCYMTESSCCHYLSLIKLMLLKHSTTNQDNWVTYSMMTILVLDK